MQQISFSQTQFTFAKTRTSERAELVREFVDTLNLERRVQNYRRWKKDFKHLTPDQFKKEKIFLKPLLPNFVAFKMSHLKLPELYFFLKRCQSGEFSKIWWGALKIKN